MKTQTEETKGSGVRVAKHDRRFCLDCGKKLNSHEWLYGACSSCIKERAKRNGWITKKKRGAQDELGWFYADNAPRWAEYADPKEMDNNGVVLLFETMYANSKLRGESEAPQLRGRPRGDAPEGFKKCSTCGKLISMFGMSRCEECRDRKNRHVNKLRAERREMHECIRCGTKLPDGYDKSCCEGCRAKQKIYNDRRYSTN